MISAGVLAGANRPNKVFASYPGRPEPAIVGMPGNSAEGLGLVTARAFSLPDLICGVTEPAVANISCTSPPIKEVIAGPAFLYWMRTMLRPAMRLNFSAAIWEAEPVVPVA